MIAKNVTVRETLICEWTPRLVSFRCGRKLLTHTTWPDLLRINVEVDSAYPAGAAHSAAAAVAGSTGPQCCLFPGQRRGQGVGFNKVNQSTRLN